MACSRENAVKLFLPKEFVIRAKEDASVLMAAYRESAYDEARTRARIAREDRFADPKEPDGHWDRVRIEIAKRTGRTGRVDTATRYLQR
jgi:hypothetical protein